MASGLDQARVIDYINASVGQSAPPAGVSAITGFSAGASNLGSLRLMTVVGSSTVNGTELPTSGSYVAGTGITYATGISGAFAGATYSLGAGNNSNQAALSQTGMPASTINGIEIWDSAVTPLRWWWGGLTTQVTTNAGDTLSFLVGAIVGTVTA